MNDLSKWNGYYSDPHKAPPWESAKPYHGLISFMEDMHIRIVQGMGGMVGGGVGGAFGSAVLGKTVALQSLVKTEAERLRGDQNARRAIQRGAYVCELGAGCSASALFLSELGFKTTAVDISPLARRRFFDMYREEPAAHRVNYLVADVLDLDGSHELHRQLLATLPRAEHSYVDVLDATSTIRMRGRGGIQGGDASRTLGLSFMLTASQDGPLDLGSGLGRASVLSMDSFATGVADGISYAYADEYTSAAGDVYSQSYSAGTPQSLAAMFLDKADFAGSPAGGGVSFNDASACMHDSVASSHHSASADSLALNSFVDEGASYRSSSSAGSSPSAGGSSAKSNYSTQLLRHKQQRTATGALQSWPILGNKRTDAGSVVSVSTGDGSGGFEGAAERLQQSSESLAEQASKWRADQGESGWTYMTTDAFEAAKASRAARDMSKLAEVASARALQKKSSYRKFDVLTIPVDAGPQQPVHSHAEVYLPGSMSGSSIGSTRDHYRQPVPGQWERIEHGDVATGVPSIVPAELRGDAMPNPLMFAETPGLFSFIFDMQCFHCLRDIDEQQAVNAVARLLKPGGYCMIVVGANPRHSECSLEEVMTMRRRKKARLDRAAARAQARKDAVDAAALAEWERLNSQKRDKYSDIRVDKQILVRLDQELEKQQRDEAAGMQQRVAFINDQQEYFVLSEQGYRAKDANDRYNREEEERMLAWEAMQHALDMEHDAVSDQAFASVSSRQLGSRYPGDASVSFFDGSSLESATFIDLDASSVGTYASYDASSVASHWLPAVSDNSPGVGTIGVAGDSPQTTAHGSFVSSTNIAGNLRIQSIYSGADNHSGGAYDAYDAYDAYEGASQQDTSVHEAEDVAILPEDMSVSTDQSSFPSLQSLPSLQPPYKSPGGRGGSWGGDFLAHHSGGSGQGQGQGRDFGAHSVLTTASSKGHATKYFRSPYHIHGQEPPRPFSPPAMVVPKTDGKNWSREESAYDRMLEQERKDKAGLTTRKQPPARQPNASAAPSSRPSMRNNSLGRSPSSSQSPLKLPLLIDPRASASATSPKPKSPQGAGGASSARARHARSAVPKHVSKPGPPRLYKCELITPFIENEAYPMVLEYCRLTTFNSTATYLDMMANIPSLDEDSDEEAWAEMEGVSQATAKADSNSRGVATAPLCWEAVFRRRTQEEILADIS